ncbi:U3 small nucleolar RNA-associated protein [Pelomyxa schiedti]|nr:U3 small nucleolar RNA-associated protein [Pelomyxa schiedti]
MAMLRTSYELKKKIPPIWSGGPVCVSDWPGAPKQVIVAATDSAVCVSDALSGTMLHTIEMGSNVTSVTTRPLAHNGGYHVISASMNRRVLVTSLGSDFASTTPVKAIKCPAGFVMSLCCDSTGTFLAMGTTVAKLLVIDIEKGYFTHNLTGHTGIVSPVVFHPDSSHPCVAASSADNIIRYWDLSNNTHIAMSTHQSTVVSLAFTPNGAYLVSSSIDNIIAIWNLRTTNPVAVIPSENAIHSLTVLPKLWFDPTVWTSPPAKSCSQVILGAGDQGGFKGWSLEDGQLLWSDVSPVVPPTYLALRYSTALEKLFLATHEQDIIILNKKLKPESRLVGNRGEIIDLVWLNPTDYRPNDTVVVVTNTDKVQLLDLVTYQTTMLEGHTAVVMCAAVDPKGNSLATGGKDNTIRVWDLHTLNCIHVVDGHTNAVTAIGWTSPIAFFSASSDTTLKSWMIVKEKGGVVNVVTKGTVKAHDKDINSIAIAPNGMVATGSQDKSVKLWSSKLEPVGSLIGHKRGVWSVEFSPVDQVVASASADGTIRIWAVSTRICVRVLEHHGAPVLKSHFLTKGMQLICSGNDGLLRLWSLKSTECIASYDGHTEKVWALTVGGDGKTLVSGGADATIVIWNDNTEVVERAKKEEENASILKLQALNNFLYTNQHIKALELSLELNHKLKTLEILEAIIDWEVFPCVEKLEAVLLQLSAPNLMKLLGFLRDWNTSAKRCDVAQAVLYCLLRWYDVNKFVGLASPQARLTIEALISYTERHYNRMCLQQQSCCLLDYALTTLGLPSDILQVNTSTTPSAPKLSSS